MDLARFLNDLLKVISEKSDAKRWIFKGDVNFPYFWAQLEFTFYASNISFDYFM